jgi:hypothetical protein
MTKALGRAPLGTEFKPLSRLVDRYGSTQRVERIASSLVDADAIVSAREEKRVNFLTYSHAAPPGPDSATHPHASR